MPSTSAHTVKAFDEDLEDLRACVAQLGGAAENAVRAAMEALLRLDGAAADAALDRAAQIQAQAEAVERRGICLIALRAPLADDLREVLTALKIVGIVERIAAHARHVAAAVVELDAGRAIASPLALGRLARLTLEALHRSLDAFAARDPGAADGVCSAAGAAEGHYAELLQETLSQMRRDPQSVAGATSLLFVARSLLRIAAQAGDIARAVRFSVTGGQSATAAADASTPTTAVRGSR